MQPTKVRSDGNRIIYCNNRELFLHGNLNSLCWLYMTFLTCYALHPVSHWHCHIHFVEWATEKIPQSAKLVSRTSRVLEHIAIRFAFQFTAFMFIKLQGPTHYHRPLPISRGILGSLRALISSIGKWGVVTCSRPIERYCLSLPRVTLSALDTHVPTSLIQALSCPTFLSWSLQKGPKDGIRIHTCLEKGNDDLIRANSIGFNQALGCFPAISHFRNLPNFHPGFKFLFQALFHLHKILLGR